MRFGPEQQENLSVFLHNGDWRGRKWQIWSRNLSIIPIPRFTNLPNKLVLIWNSITPVYNNTHMCFRAEHPQN